MQEHTIKLLLGCFFSLVLGVLILFSAATEYVLSQTLLIVLLGLIGALLNINPFELVNSDDDNDSDD